jgi:hypothetical protein
MRNLMSIYYVHLTVQEFVQNEDFIWPVTEERDLPKVPDRVNLCTGRTFKPYVVVGKASTKGL